MKDPDFSIYLLLNPFVLEKISKSYDINCICLAGDLRTMSTPVGNSSNLKLDTVYDSRKS